MRKPVAITGLGAVSAFGAGVAALEEGLRSGRSPIGPLRRFDSAGYHAAMAAEVPPGLDLPGGETRCEGLALSAASEAWAGAGKTGAGATPRRVAVIIGTSAGSMDGVTGFRRAEVEGEALPDVSVHRPCVIGNLGDRIAVELGLSGPRFGISTACSSSAFAIAVAADLVKDGRVDAAIAGGAEVLSEYVFAGFHSLAALDPVTCRPFDEGRRGLVLGEGAAAVVLERPEDVRADGREPLAFFSGYGLTCDSSHMTAPDQTGREAARSMRLALRDAGLDAEGVDHVDAHATGTPRGDIAEVRGIEQVTEGVPRPPTVSALKSMLGHALGAAGALGTVASVLMLRGGYLFPTANLESPEPACEANHVVGPAKADRPRVVVSNAFAFGGNNVSCVLRSGDE